MHAQLLECLLSRSTDSEQTGVLYACMASQQTAMHTGMFMPVCPEAHLCAQSDVHLRCANGPCSQCLLAARG